VVEQQSSSVLEMLAVSWAVLPGQDVESKTRLWLLPSRRANCGIATLPFRAC